MLKVNEFFESHNHVRYFISFRNCVKDLSFTHINIPTAFKTLKFFNTLPNTPYETAVRTLNNKVDRRG